MKFLKLFIISLFVILLSACEPVVHLTTDIHLRNFTQEDYLLISDIRNCFERNYPTEKIEVIVRFDSITTTTSSTKTYPKYKIVFDPKPLDDKKDVLTTVLYFDENGKCVIY